VSGKFDVGEHTVFDVQIHRHFIAAEGIESLDFVRGRSG
jgi:hypothetical protein